MYKDYSAHKKIASILVISTIAFVSYYTWMKPFSGDAATADIVVSGTVTAGISITANSTPVSLGSIDGFNGGSATVDASWTVKTNNKNGYKLEINKNHLFWVDPSGGTDKEFDDYISSGSPTYDWSVANDERKFGFAVKTLPSGATADARYLNDGSGCNTGSTFTSEKCWDTLPDTTPRQIVTKSTKTSSSGDATAISLQAQIGVPVSGSYLESGSYTTTITATATVL